MTTALAAMQMGVQFNVERYLTQIAFEMGISDIIEDIFVDPEWQQKMEIMLTLGPQNPGKASSGNSVAGSQQNKGNPQAKPIATPQQDFNANSQQTAAIGQSMSEGVY